MENVRVYTKSNGIQATAKVVIKDFVELMSSSKPKDCYPSDTFVVGDVPMVLNVYPNGNNDQNKGNVSILLKTHGAITVKCKITTDAMSKNFEHAMEPTTFGGEWGYPKFLSHDRCSNEYRDKDFVVTVDV